MWSHMAYDTYGIYVTTYKGGVDEMLEGSIAVTFSITSVFRGKGGEIFYVKGGSGKEIV